MKKALLILGGSYHNFDGYSKWLTKFLAEKEWKVISTFDLNTLLTLEDADFDLVVSYTCFSANPDLVNQKGSGMMEEAQVAALHNWVHTGGAFYAVHGASVQGETNHRYVDLVGGHFIKHPPAFEYTVYPMFGEHEVIKDIGAFTVTEELYIEEYDGTLDVLMVSMLDDVVHPMVWCKHEGLGRVVHNALGHMEDTWNMPEYQQLTLQSINWLMDWIQ